MRTALIAVLLVSIGLLHSEAHSQANATGTPGQPNAFDWAQLGALGILAAMMFYFYRRDSLAWRRQYIEDRDRSEKLYASLALNFREVVQDNTKAMTTITVLLENGVGTCPVQRAAMEQKKEQAQDT